MTILSSFAPQTEFYSIDEAFLDFTGLVGTDLERLGMEIRQRVWQHTGIPVSIGIAPSKTLAKMANRFAKKTKRKIGVHLLQGSDAVREVLEWTAVSDIWGIGPARAKLCIRNGVRTALALSNAPDDWVRKEMSVVGLRLLHELRGIPSIEWELETHPMKKSICTSRSFGKLLTSKADISQAVANYTASCAEKLRHQASCANRLQLFLQTNPHRPNDRQYFRSIMLPLSVATNSTPELVKTSLWGLDRIYREGFKFMKCGVMVLDLVPADQVQAGLFDKRDRNKDALVMATMDAINKRFGPDQVKLAVQGFDRRYRLRQSHLSPRYTTRIEEIVGIR